ncbi:MAG: nitroreductase/quinone reductase family protein [Acidimicrobiales bacterium]
MLKLIVAFDRTIGRVTYRAHLRLYRLTRGVIGHRSPVGPMLILESFGRRSGLVRSNPLLYFAHEGRYFVVASNGGRGGNPSWLFNVRDNDQVKVQAGAKRFHARARELNDDERNAIWPSLTSFYGGWAHYETLTNRSIRVVELTPLAE